jgi:hypothetical protein
MLCHACSAPLRADDGALCPACRLRAARETAMYHVTLHAIGDPYPIREWLVAACTPEEAELVMGRVEVGEGYYLQYRPVAFTDGLHELTAP